jgi:hypothetical protein
MAPARPAGLQAADPQVGQTLRFDGVDWEVTDHSSYWDAGGYRVTEWCCESADTEAYLLKEVKEGEPTRWFFTRSIPAAAVTGPGGDAVTKRPSGAETPPATLTYDGESYRYAETTDGTYEEEPGQRTGKATWEYWDAAHLRNLAVEVWPDGRIDCYRGTYIEPGQVTLTSAAAARAEDATTPAARRIAPAARPGRTWTLVANPFLAAAVAFPLAYAVAFVTGRPFDQSLAAALGLAGIAGWLFGLLGAPRAGGLVLLGAPALAVGFWRFPPLTSAVGLAALVAAPAAVAWLARAGRRGPVLYAATTVVAAPALGVGLYHYFRFAPEPHRLEQLGLALGPAVIGGVVACLVAALVLARVEAGAE